MGVTAQICELCLFQNHCFMPFSAKMKYRILWNTFSTFMPFSEKLTITFCLICTESCASIGAIDRSKKNMGSLPDFFDITTIGLTYIVEYTV